MFIFIIHLMCNVVISRIVLYSIYIGLTIIKCNVLTCFDNSHLGIPTKSGAWRLYCWSIATFRLVHCDYRGRLRAFGSWGIQAEGHSDYNPLFPVLGARLTVCG